MNNIFRLHLFGVIYWSEADIFLILVYLGKVNRYKWTFLNIFRAGAARRTVDGGRDCDFYSEMLWKILWKTLNVQFNRFIFVPLIEIVFPC